MRTAKLRPSSRLATRRRRSCEISEINTGIYLLNASLLRTALAELRDDNAQHEFYLTDIVAIARGHGRMRHRMVARPMRPNLPASIRGRISP